MRCNIWAAALIMFFAMLRCSNVLPLSAPQFDNQRMLCRRDVTFHPDRLMLSIRWSKTIQFAQHTLQLPLPRIPGHILCPVQAMFKALSFASGAAPSSPLFIATPPDKPLTAPIFLTMVRQALQKHGISGADISCHSFRRGGASWAFQAGVPTDTIRQVGDWQSNAYIKYIYESPDSLKRSMVKMVTKI